MEDKKCKFECKIEKDRWDPEEDCFTMTHNGFQWQSITINKSIALKMKAELDKYLSQK